MTKNNKIELKVGVKILLKNKEGKYLILRRSENKYPEVGSKWDIAGGRINIGETLIDNLKREVVEETKLEIISEPKLIYAQDILKIEGKHIVRLTYIGNSNGEVILSEEHDEYKWVTLFELENMEPMDKYVKEIISKKLIQ